MYVKDSVIEAQIEVDLQKQRLRGMIEEIEHEINLSPKGSSQRALLEKRLEKLRGELNLHS